MERESNRSPLTQGLAFVAALALIGGVAAGYESALTPVTLVIDGNARQIRTQQETVGALLIDAGITLRPEDHVEPPPSSAITPGMTVEVTLARPVLVEADGSEQRILTRGVLIDEILAEAGLSLGTHDRVEAEEVVGPDNRPLLRIRIRRAIPITFHENGRAVTFYTTATTVGTALQEVGITLYLADRIEPGHGQPLSAGTHIYLERSRPVSVQVDGRTIRTRTHRDRVGDVLADLGIVLAGLDYADPPPTAPLDDETAIRVTRVTERFLIEQQPIPFQVVWQPDPDLEIDNQRLIQEGAAGVLERRVRLRFEDGQEISRTLDSQYVAVAPTTKIYGYGTRIVIRTIDTPEGPREYWRVIRMLATSYSASTAGTPRSASWYGRTFGGCVMGDNIVAVSTLVPWKSHVYVPGYGIGYACDRGGAIRGRRIDLGYADENLVLWYRWVDVYLLTPVPPADQINYTISQ